MSILNPKKTARDKLIIELLLTHHARRNLKEQPYIEYLQIITARDQVLLRFQPDFQNPDQLQEKTFRDFLAFEHNHHWTGLHRPSKHACDDMPKLRRAIAYLFDESIAIADRLNALDTNENLSVIGISHGILTPLLLIRYPEKYGVWNGKSEAALKVLDIWPTFQRGASLGERYVQLNNLFLKYSISTGLDLWCLDGLWHVVNEASQRATNKYFEKMEVEEREYYEGKPRPHNSIKKERSAAARIDCLSRQGLRCKVCDFSFFDFYGELGTNYIHVHHVEDLAHSKESKRIHPGKDLVPVCANCHAMLHKGVTSARSVDELKQIIQHVAKTTQ